MKNILIIIALALSVSGCFPQIATFEVEVKENNSFALDMTEKNMAIFAVTDSNRVDSLIVTEMANGFAAEAEKHFTGSVVSAYNIPEEEFSTTQDSTYLDKLMVGSASQILVFLRNMTFYDFAAYPVAERNDAAEVKLPFSLKLYVYDAIADSVLYRKAVADTVSMFVLSAPDDSENVKNAVAQRLTDVGQAIGKALVAEVVPHYKGELWQLFDYPDLGRWHDAYLLAMEFRWQEAIEKWMTLTEGDDDEKTAYASYNIAVACEMLDRRELAKEWVNLALKKFTFKEAKLLQQKLNAK